MALTDIIKRIERDASEEAASVLADAEARASAILAEAREKAAEDAQHIADSARREAHAEAATRIAAARLRARDEDLAARRELVEEALSRVAAAIEALPPAEYATFLGDAIAAHVRGGDVVSLAADDVGVTGAVRDRVEAVKPGLAVRWSPEPAMLERGALIVGSRTRAEVSPRSIVAERRDELEVSIASALFVDEEV